MRRLAATLMAFALCLAGCASVLPGGDQVRLLTGPPGAKPNSNLGCFTFGVTGQLVADPTYGTAVIVSSPAVTGGRSVLAWRPGFSARRTGSAIVVLDPGGNVAAVTGRTYYFPGGYVPAGGSSIDWPDLPVDVFWTCDTLQ